MHKYWWHTYEDIDKAEAAGVFDFKALAPIFDGLGKLHVGVTNAWDIIKQLLDRQSNNVQAYIAGLYNHETDLITADFKDLNWFQHAITNALLGVWVCLTIFSRTFDIWGKIAKFTSPYICSSISRAHQSMFEPIMFDFKHTDTQETYKDLFIHAQYDFNIADRNTNYWICVGCELGQSKLLIPACGKLDVLCARFKNILELLSHEKD